MNGILEQWHTTLKNAILCHQMKKWVGILYKILLELRTCFKEYLQCSLAKLIFGTEFGISGDFILDESNDCIEAVFASNLQEQMKKLRSIPTSYHKQQFRTIRS